MVNLRLPLYLTATAVLTSCVPNVDVRGGTAPPAAVEEIKTDIQTRINRIQAQQDELAAKEKGFHIEGLSTQEQKILRESEDQLEKELAEMKQQLHDLLARVDALKPKPVDEQVRQNCLRYYNHKVRLAITGGIFTAVGGGLTISGLAVAPNTTPAASLSDTQQQAKLGLGISGGTVTLTGGILTAIGASIGEQLDRGGCTPAIIFPH
jgi:hypothetical protein